MSGSPCQGSRDRTHTSDLNVRARHTPARLRRAGLRGRRQQHHPQPGSIPGHLQHLRRSPFSPSRFIDTSMVSVSPDVDREGASVGSSVQQRLPHPEGCVIWLTRSALFGRLLWISNRTERQPAGDVWVGDKRAARHREWSVPRAMSVAGAGSEAHSGQRRRFNARACARVASGQDPPETMGAPPAPPSVQPSSAKPSAMASTARPSSSGSPKRRSRPIVPPSKWNTGPGWTPCPKSDAPACQRSAPSRAHASTVAALSVVVPAEGSRSRPFTAVLYAHKTTVRTSSGPWTPMNARLSVSCSSSGCVGAGRSSQGLDSSLATLGE